MSFSILPRFGFRERYSYAELAKFFGMSKRQVVYLVESNALRVRFPRSKYPVHAQDAERFLRDFNNGRKSSPQSRGIPVERASARGLERAG